ncbi:Transmembrane protein [Microcystis aeruginosa]
MSYPKWFPRPKSWLRTIVFLIAMTPVLFVVQGLTFVLGPIHIITGNLWILGLYLILVVVIPVWMLSHVHQFLWGERNPKFPKWIPSLRSWADGIFSLTVALFIMTSIIVWMFIYLEATGEVTESRLDHYTERHIGTIFIIFMITMSYAYHLKSLIGAKFQAKRTP